MRWHHPVRPGFLHSPTYPCSLTASLPLTALHTASLPLTALLPVESKKLFLQEGQGSVCMLLVHDQRQEPGSAQSSPLLRTRAGVRFGMVQGRIRSVDSVGAEVGIHGGAAGIVIVSYSSKGISELVIFVSISVLRLSLLLLLPLSQSSLVPQEVGEGDALQVHISRLYALLRREYRT